MATTKGMTSDQQKALTDLFEVLTDHYPSVARIEVRYDGYNEEARAKAHTFYDQEGNVADIQDKKLSDLIDDLFIVVAPEGFEIRYGSCGKIVVDISTRIVHVGYMTMLYKKWFMEYMTFKGVEPKWYVLTSERSNASVFSGTIEECKEWIDEKVASYEEMLRLKPFPRREV